MKLSQLFAAFVLTVSLVACGGNSTAPSNPETSSGNIPQSNIESTDARLSAQASDCRYYLGGFLFSFCSNNQTREVNVAGDMFRRAKPYMNSSDRATTVAAAYLNGNQYVTVYGGSTYNAKLQIKNQVESAGYIWVPTSGTTHAEQRLYNVYGGDLIDIGISNPNGPCPSCVNGIQSSVTVTWYPGYYW